MSSTYAPDLSDSRDLRALLDRVSAITAEALDPHSHTVPSGAELLQETWSQNPLDQHLTHPLNEQVIETVQPEPVPGPPPDQSQWDVPFTPSTSLDMVAWGTNNPGMHP